MLFVAGEPSHSLYFICSGRVKVYRAAADGREQILHLLGDGDPIAVVPFLDGDPYPANAEVLTDSEIAVIQFEDFERIARANPGILVQMLRILTRRLRHAQEEIASLRSKASPGGWPVVCWTWPGAREIKLRTAFRWICSSAARSWGNSLGRHAKR